MTGNFASLALKSLNPIRNSKDHFHFCCSFSIGSLVFTLTAQELTCV